MIERAELEDDLECSFEDIVKTILFLGRALNKALEGILLRGLLDLLSSNDLLETMAFASALDLALALFTQI